MVSHISENLTLTLSLTDGVQTNFSELVLRGFLTHKLSAQVSLTKMKRCKNEPLVHSSDAEVFCRIFKCLNP